MSNFLFSDLIVNNYRYRSVDVGISTVFSISIVSFSLHLGAAELNPGGGRACLLFPYGFGDVMLYRELRGAEGLGWIAFGYGVW